MWIVSGKVVDERDIGLKASAVFMRAVFATGSICTVTHVFCVLHIEDNTNIFIY